MNLQMKIFNQNTNFRSPFQMAHNSSPPPTRSVSSPGGSWTLSRRVKMESRFAIFTAPLWLKQNKGKGGWADDTFICWGFHVGQWPLALEKLTSVGDSAGCHNISVGCRMIQHEKHISGALHRHISPILPISIFCHTQFENFDGFLNLRYTPLPLATTCPAGRTGSPLPGSLGMPPSGRRRRKSTAGRPEIITSRTGKPETSLDGARPHSICAVLHAVRQFMFEAKSTACGQEETDVHRKPRRAAN